MLGREMEKTCIGLTDMKFKFVPKTTLFFPLNTPFFYDNFGTNLI